MSKNKKLYSLSDEVVQKIEVLRDNNPGISSSEIIEASVMMMPDNAIIKRETKIKYSIN